MPSAPVVAEEMLKRTQILPVLTHEVKANPRSVVWWRARRGTAQKGAHVARTTRTDTYIQRLRSRPVAVVLGVVTVLVVATQFTDVLGDIRRFVGGTPVEGGPCAARSGSVAIRAYTLALTNPTELGILARDNAALFAADGDAISCYRALAAALASNANLTQLEALRDRAEAERQTGLDFNRSAYATDLADTLQELAGSLPALANTDDGPYRATKAYESAQAYSTLLQRAPGASAGIDTLLQGDEDVLRELAARLGGR